MEERYQEIERRLDEMQKMLEAIYRQLMPVSPQLPLNRVYDLKLRARKKALELKGKQAIK